MRIAFAEFLAQPFESGVNDLLGNGLFPIAHYNVYQPTNQGAVVFWVWSGDTLCSSSSP